MIWLVPLVGALAYWLGTEQPPARSLGWPREPAARPMVGGFVGEDEPPAWPDPFAWHAAAALVSPLSYAYGELREIVAILDHRGAHDDADRLAIVVLGVLPYMRARAMSGDQPSRAWFAPHAGRFSFGVPPYPPPPPSIW